MYANFGNFCDVFILNRTATEMLGKGIQNSAAAEEQVLPEPHSHGGSGKHPIHTDHHRRQPNWGHNIIPVVTKDTPYQQRDKKKQDNNTTAKRQNSRSRRYGGQLQQDPRGPELLGVAAGNLS
jgi:hypothetical protein